MVVETITDFDSDSTIITFSILNLQAEQEEFRAKFQLARPEAVSFEKWTLMERIYNL